MTFCNIFSRDNVMPSHVFRKSWEKYSFCQLLIWEQPDMGQILETALTGHIWSSVLTASQSKLSNHPFASITLTSAQFLTINSRVENKSPWLKECAGLEDRTRLPAHQSSKHATACMHIIQSFYSKPLIHILVHVCKGLWNLHLYRSFQEPNSLRQITRFWIF